MTDKRCGSGLRSEEARVPLRFAELRTIARGEHRGTLVGGAEDLWRETRSGVARSGSRPAGARPELPRRVSFAGPPGSTEAEPSLPLASAIRVADATNRTVGSVSRRNPEGTLDLDARRFSHFEKKKKLKKVLTEARRRKLSLSSQRRHTFSNIYKMESKIVRALRKFRQFMRSSLVRFPAFGRTERLDSEGDVTSTRSRSRPRVQSPAISQVFRDGNPFRERSRPGNRVWQAKRSVDRESDKVTDRIDRPLISPQARPISWPIAKEACDALRIRTEYRSALRGDRFSKTRKLSRRLRRMLDEIAAPDDPPPVPFFLPAPETAVLDRGRPPGSSSERTFAAARVPSLLVPVRTFKSVAVTFFADLTFSVGNLGKYSMPNQK